MEGGFPAKFAESRDASLRCNVLLHARKKSTKIRFLGPETAGKGGGLPREGVVVKKFVPSLESLSSLGLEGRDLGCPGNFAGMSRDPWGCSKSLFQKSGTKKEPKPKLSSPDIFWWGGGLPREGVGAKKFGMSLETQGIKLFWRDIPGFCRDIPEAPEKFEKKMFGFNSRPLKKVRANFSFPDDMNRALSDPNRGDFEIANRQRLQSQLKKFTATLRAPSEANSLDSGSASFVWFYGVSEVPHWPGTSPESVATTRL